MFVQRSDEFGFFIGNVNLFFAINWFYYSVYRDLSIFVAW